MLDFFYTCRGGTTWSLRGIGITKTGVFEHQESSIPNDPVSARISRFKSGPRRMKKWLITLLLLISCTAPSNVEVLVENLKVPWAIAFLPDNSFLFTERDTGNVYHYDGAAHIIGTVPIAQTSESGLLGIAIDPNFSTNKFVYAYYTYAGNESHLNRVSRFAYDGKLTSETTLIGAIPGAKYHDGGRIAFGPDGKLYITAGDALNPSQAQDLNSTAGKILRINPDGSIPSDNPFPNSPVYSYGHRNPQGLAWNNGMLFAPEHGQTQNDEINIIKPGLNYGWPIVQCTNHTGYEPPIRCFSDWTLAPSGAAFDTKGNLYVAGLRGSQIRKFAMKDGDIVSEEVFLENLGRLREVKFNNGYLYIATSNQDGRGIPRLGDDKIIRVQI